MPKLFISLLKIGVASTKVEKKTTVSGNFSLSNLDAFKGERYGKKRGFLAPRTDSLSRLLRNARHIQVRILLPFNIMGARESPLTNK